MSKRSYGLLLVGFLVTSTFMGSERSIRGQMEAQPVQEQARRRNEG